MLIIYAKKNGVGLVKSETTVEVQCPHIAELFYLLVMHSAALPFIMQTIVCQSQRAIYQHAILLSLSID